MHQSTLIPSFAGWLQSGLSRLALIFLAGVATAGAQTTVINYTGALNLNGAPFTGTAEFQFTLWDALTSGNQVAASAPDAMIVGVTNGVFATSLDFGASAFSGAHRWLQVQVRTNIAPFSTLSPRQPISSVPYAIRAAVASTTELPSGNYSNAVVFSNPGNLFAGNGFALTGLNAANLASGTVADARLGANIARTNQVWLLGGNTGINATNHFIGTTDQRPLEFRANGQRVLRLESGGDSHDPDIVPDGAPNVIAGSHVNYVSNGIAGATISGGGAVNFNGTSASNRVFQHYGTIGGGLGNEASGVGSTVSGGASSRASGFLSTIGGGENNAASALRATVSGGGNNTANGNVSTISGGFNNAASGNGSVVSGGYQNTTGGEASTVSGGADNSAPGEQSTVGGGQYNTAGGTRSVIAGGGENQASGILATIGGGRDNIASGQSSTVGGGTANVASGQDSTVPGGTDNQASGSFSLAAGVRAKALHRASFVWADGNGGGINTDFASTAMDQFCIRARGGVRLSDLTSIYCGSNTRQMINLFDNDYGIGVQNSTAYFRSNGRFSWFRNGVHNDAQNDPGTGGSVLMTLTSGGLTVNGAFVNASDRDRKENFESIDSAEVLAKVLTLPINKWSYRDDEERNRHLGPMAQDFHAAFGVGPDEKHIATVDADGVALAAIQGLNQKVEQTTAAEAARILNLEARNATLEQRLADLEKLVSKLGRP